MLPRLGQKYEIETEVISKPRVDYHTDEYEALGLPPAPAAMVSEEVVVQGPNLSEDQVGSRHSPPFGIAGISRQRPKRDSWNGSSNNSLRIFQGSYPHEPEEPEDKLDFHPRRSKS